jgi:PIN domain nuclease of toxin-antitoxin system
MRLLLDTHIWIWSLAEDVLRLLLEDRALWQDHLGSLVFEDTLEDVTR